MSDRAELGSFLRSRRARVQPADVGLRELGRRRVSGLRREEIAMLAGISVEHYARIEQARGARPSASVLESLASALRLDDAERTHLLELGGAGGPLHRTPDPSPAVRPGIRRLLEQTPHPAFVLGAYMDVLAWNRLAAALLGDFGQMPPHERNMARLVFLDRATIDLYPDWEEVAHDTVAYLRRDAAMGGDDPRLTALVDELAERSDDFRRWWSAHDVRDKAFGSKRLRHPRVGDLELDWETLPVAGAAGQALVVYTAEPGTASAAALEELRRRAATSRRLAVA
jgi:transcriptional regulator with XRE-family HTH domain